MYHASLYARIENKKANCRVCRRWCTISPGERGWCKTRINKGGKLFSLTYGRISTMAISPIEKKPLFHYRPGSLWLSVGSVGCNFRCPGCQNWESAHAIPSIKGECSVPIKDSDKLETKNILEYVSPELIIEIAHRERVRGISFTYNEPTLWIEFTERVMNLAKQSGIHTNWVTNGYLTFDALDMIGPYLDSIRIDIKGFSSSTYRKISGISDYEGILDVARRAKGRWGAHCELVTNVIPGINDNIDELCLLARWIIKDMGSETPWHITRYFPNFIWDNIPETRITELEHIYRMAKREGLTYPYLGNAPGHPYENSYCPGCGSVLIERGGSNVVSINVSGGLCPKCGTKIFGVFD